MANYLTELDERKRELEDDNPSWQIWYVPHTDRTVTWCARPRPLLNTDSPEQLQQLIDQARDESDSPRANLESIARETREPELRGDCSAQT
jgi:hypothetical protein